MMHETIAKIEARLQNAGALKDETRQELLNLLARLKNEVGELSETHADDARSIAAFTELSAHEATRAEKNPRLLELSLSGLKSSVDGFEESHPRLVQVVNSICNALSSLGI